MKQTGKGIKQAVGKVIVKILSKIAKLRAKQMGFGKKRKRTTKQVGRGGMSELRTFHRIHGLK